MKFTFTQSSMVKVLQKVMGAVPTKMPMPSLSNLYIKLKDRMLEITATDLEITITAKVEVLEVEGEGSILIQAKRFQDLVRELPDVPLEIEVQESHKITLRGEGVGVYILPGGDPMDFPELPPVEAQISLPMSGVNLKRMIVRTVFAVSHDEMRPILTGILMQLRPGELRVVATDGHRLSRVIRRGIEYGGEPRDVVVPMKALNLLLRSLDDEDELDIGFAETRASFNSSDQWLTTRLIDGHYPKYESVIPDDNPFKMSANTGDFIAAVKRVSIFANQISRQIKLHIEAESISFETEDPEMGGKGQETITVNYEGSELDIAYNSNYLMDVLKLVESEEVIFTFKSSNDAAIIKSTVSDDDEDLLMLLMPIRLR